MGVQMKTSIDVDENLLKQAMDYSKLSTKKAVVNFVLEEYVRANNCQKILKYKDSGIWEGNLEQMRAMG
jgi:Arc/MetJ family transcription regulator